MTLTNRPKGYRRILAVENAKTTKGEALGYLTGILYLAPANESGVMNTCPMATDACRAACLFTAGRGRFDAIRQGRINKTLLLHSNRALFLDCLRWDIGMIVRRAGKLGLKPCVRINGTSDLAWLAAMMADEFPTVQLYDYTKLSKPELRVRSNYWLTFSYSGANLAECLRVLPLGVNVSVVFTTRKGETLPAFWNGYPVVDGDTHDLRFLDGAGVIVGLRAKGDARKQTSPFIVLAA
ncbi:MAG: hypothetical protein WBY44_09635 [Bryobacteraceae bacterium]